MTPLRSIPLSAAARLLLAGLFVSIAACDGGDPIDRPQPSEVAATYQFTQLLFQPDAPGLAPADVLARLDQSETSLRLSSNANYLLSYQLIGGGPYFLIGDFDVTAQTVRLAGDDGQGVDYQRILLDPAMTLQRGAGATKVLTADIRKSVNLQAFDPQTYAGLTSVPGTLRIRLIAP